MSQIAEQKCPACGAPLRFDPASGKLVCDYCGTVTDLKPEAEHGEKDLSMKPAKKPGKAGAKPQDGHLPDGKESPEGSASADSADAEGLLEGFDFDHMTDLLTDPDAMDLPVYNCVSCGAEVIAPAEQVALTCPYCGNNIVLTQKVTGKLRPDGVIPFRIQSKDLPDAVNRFYKNKKLLPRRFFSTATMGSVTGVYVPFWVFNGNVSGTMQYRAQTTSSSRRGDYIYTKTNYYRLVREAALSFENLPVDASSKMSDRLMDSLEPFDISKTEPFDMRYLAGFTADRFDQKKKDISQRAEKRMISSTTDIVTAHAAAGYGAVSYEGGKLRTDVKARYILFPVYMFDISYAGKKYSFAVNGQTGKVVGDLPTDSGVSFMYFLKRFGIVTGGIIALSFAKYMLGM